MSQSESSSNSSESYTYATAWSDQEEILLKFRNIKAWVSNLKVTNEDGETEIIKRRDILRGVSGTIRSGEMTMLMGASGAGKSTLLDVLSGRATTVESSGTITLNGEPFGLAEFQEHSAYVTQDAVFINSLTPQDILSFRAKVMLPSSTSSADRAARVDEVIELMGLGPVRDVPLGEPGASARSLSTVDRKKLNVAQALLAHPRILFCDEPTTALDSAAAVSMVRSLRRVANTGIVVFATLHQPSVKIFEAFDTAQVMALGQMGYEGPVSDLVAMLDQVGYPLPEFRNPADHVIQILDSRDGDEDRVQKLINDLSGRTQSSSSTGSSESGASDESGVELGTNGRPMAKLSSRGARPGFLARLYYLFGRAFKVSLRNEQALKASLGQAIMFGVLIGILYDLDLTQQGAQNRVGVLFLTLTNALFLSAQAAAFVFVGERAVFVRQVADGSYGIAEYYLAQVLAAVPFQIFYQVVFSAIVYFWIGLESSFEQFVIFLAVQSLVSMIGANLGMSLGAFTGDAATAVSLAPVVIVPSMLTSGVLVSTDTMPVWLRPLRYISLLRYGFSALLINEAEDLVFTCTAEEQTGSGACPIATGADLIRQRDADEEPSELGTLILILSVFYVLSVGLIRLGLAISLRSANKTKSE